MPQYRTEIVYSTNDPLEQGDLVEVYDRIKNEMGVQDITILVQGNKYTIIIIRYDAAPTIEQGEFEIILDLYQHFFDGLNPEPEPEDILDMLYWEIKDIDLSYYLTDVTTEAI